MFSNIYKDKKVLVTGHTGFKGSWLSTWLLKLGANVIGYSKEIPTNPSMFEDLGLSKKLNHIIGDVRDFDKLKKIIDTEEPDFIFHLAAQAIVSISYNNPVETFSTNVNGTINLLEALKNYSKPCVAIFITSDKCYENVEWIWGYRETDPLGGKDIYSGSKAAAEIAIKTYFHSFFQKLNHPVKIAIGRAGNVIGGGDWATDRIIVDCIKSWGVGKPVEIRSPNATRPWQHVLEPLSGYLTLGQAVYLNNNLNGEAFNFGPKAEQNHTVVDLLKELAQLWGFADINEAYYITDSIPFHEAGLLKLNCDKALFYLKWEANLTYNQNIKFISDWYKSYYQKVNDMFELTNAQIQSYESIALSSNKIWTKNVKNDE